MASNLERIRSIRFNQDQGCFTCCMDTSLRIYNVEPLVKKAHYDFEELDGNIKYCEMVYRTNLLVMIGGSNGDRNHSSNKVLVYDANTKSYVSEIILDSEVKSIVCRRDRIFVVLKHKIQVYTFPPPHEKLFEFDTGVNALGLIQVSPRVTSERSLLVFPAMQKGFVQIHDLSKSNTYCSSSPVTFRAHMNELSYLAMNQDGTLIATASEKGTIIRVWDIASRTSTIELRRGHDQALFYCINFSHDNQYLCCSSDKGTMHVFNFNTKSSNSLPRVSFAKIPLTPQIPSICGFSSPSTITAVSEDGFFYKYLFNSLGTSKLAYDNFLDICENDDF